MQIKNALITDTNLGYEAHGILTASIYLECEGGGTTMFGGLNLSGPSCATFIKQILDTVEVQSWEELKKQYVRVKFDDKGVNYAIGNILSDKWAFIKNF